MKNLLPKILGWIVIIITLALGPTIYTSNSAITGHASVDNMTALATVAGFGAFVIIFGLLVSGGMMAIAGAKGGAAGRTDMISVIGSVILIVISLSLMASVITYVELLYAAAITASDTLGEVGFALIPVILYSGIVFGVGFTQARTIRRMRSSRRRSNRAFL